MSEVIQFTRGLTGVRISVAPQIQAENVAINMPRVENVRLEDALNWFCFFAKAEWTLRQTEEGKGEIWVYPQVDR